MRASFSTRREGRPLVAVKLAASLDGRIAAAGGDSRWITGPEARRRVQDLRWRHDAVMVGSGTALIDNPRLSLRLPGAPVDRPWRVVLDSQAALPSTHDLVVRAGQQPTCLLTADDLPAARLASYRQAGIEVLTVPRAEGDHLSLPAALGALADLGLTRILVEGGGGLTAALLRANLLDRLYWFSAGKILGGEAIAAVGSLGLTRVVDAVRFEPVARQAWGADLLQVFERRDKPWRST